MTIRNKPLILCLTAIAAMSIAILAWAVYTPRSGEGHRGGSEDTAGTHSAPGAVLENPDNGKDHENPHLRKSLPSENAGTQVGLTVHLLSPPGTPAHCKTTVEVLSPGPEATSLGGARRRILAAAPIVDSVKFSRQSLSGEASEIEFDLNSDYLYLPRKHCVKLGHSDSSDVWLQAELGGRIACDLTQVPETSFPLTVYAAEAAAESALDALLGPHSRRCSRPSVIWIGGLKPAIYEVGVEGKSIAATTTNAAAESSSGYHPQVVRLAAGSSEFVKWPNTPPGALLVKVNVRESDGLPIKGASVYCSTLAFSRSSISGLATTNDAGKAEVSLGESEGVSIEVRVGSDSSVIYAFRDVPPGAQEVGVEIELPANMVIGRVIGPLGPIEGALVRLDSVIHEEVASWSSNTRCATSDGNGEFRFSHLPLGDYFIRVGGFSEFPQGTAENKYGLLVESVDAEPSPQRVDVELVQPGSCLIRLEEEGSPGHLRGRVFVQTSLAGLPQWQPAVQQASLLEYEATYLAPGLYSIVAVQQRNGREWLVGIAQSRVVPGNRNEVRVPLVPGHMATVRFPAPDGAPRMFRMCVSTLEEMVWPGQSEQTLLRAEHTTPPLPPDRYRIRCWALDGDYIESVVTIPEVGREVTVLRH